MPETLLSPSSVLLFGRVVEDLQIQPTGGDATPSDGHLERLLHAPGAGIARVYGFGHDGQYHVLPGPALFLVQGTGEPAASALADLKLHPDEPMAEAGTAALSLPEDLRVWICDKSDFTLRMDVQSGTFDQLLTSPAPVSVAGMSAQGMSLRGMSAQVMAPQGMSVGGMSVGGMSVPGMSAQGMSAQGMSAQGMNPTTKPGDDNT